jgi:hypothetical protein
MACQLVDVEDLEAMGGEHAPGGEEGEVREVLVVDGVELVLLDQAGDVGKLDRHHALWRQ